VFIKLVPGHQRAGREEEDRASDRLGQSQQRLRIHFLQSFARNVCKIDSARRKRCPRRSRGQGCLRWSVERLVVRVEWRSKVTRSALTHPGAVVVQAGTALHLGRGRCGAGLVAHPKHRSHAQNAFPTLTGTSSLS